MIAWIALGMVCFLYLIALVLLVTLRKIFERILSTISAGLFGGMSALGITSENQGAPVAPTKLEAPAANTPAKESPPD